MIYRSDIYIPQSENVRTIQRNLNFIASKKGWGKIIAEDGWYGNDTAEMVKLFQRRLGLSVDGIYGPQTEAALKRAISQYPSIRQAPPSQVRAPRTQTRISSDKKSTINNQSSGKEIWKIPEFLVKIFCDFCSEVENTIVGIRKLKNPTPTKFFDMINVKIQALDPNMNRIHKTIIEYKKMLAQSKVSDEILKMSKQPLFSANRGNSTYLRNKQVLAAKNQVNTANMYKRLADNKIKEIARMKNSVINSIKKYDFINKAKNAAKMGKPTVKVGSFSIPKGTIWGILLSFTKVISDLIIGFYKLAIGEFDAEDWTATFKKDLFKAFDDIIVGLIAGYIAQALVALGGTALAAVSGISAPAIVGIIAVVIIATLISLVVNYFMEENDISFSRFIANSFSSLRTKLANSVY